MSMVVERAKRGAVEWSSAGLVPEVVKLICAPKCATGNDWPMTACDLKREQAKLGEKRVLRCARAGQFDTS